MEPGGGASGPEARAETPEGLAKTPADAGSAAGVEVQSVLD